MKSLLKLAGFLIGFYFLLGSNIMHAQVTPLFNTPVQVSIEQVYLNWAPFPGAQSYQIYWSTSPGVTLSSTLIPIGSASTLGFNQVGLTSGATYYYRIRALDIASAWTQLSIEVAVVVPITPTQWYGGGIGDGHSSTFLCNSLLNGSLSTPTFNNVFVYRSAEHNRIDWIQYPGATGYLVEVSNTSGGPWANLINTTNLFFEHTNLIGNTPFFYRVTPVGGTGCVVNPSTEIGAVVIPNNNIQPGGIADGHANLLLCSSTLNGVSAPPATPDFVVYEGIQELYLFWLQVAGASSYDIEFSTSSESGPWTVLVSNLIGTNFTHSGLVAGQIYYYRMRANPTSGCPFAWSITFSGIPRPFIEATGVGIGGGVGDGHATLRTCPVFLNGAFNSPNSQAITVYMSTESNFIAWPQESGAANYNLEVATNTLGPWTLLSNTTSLAFSHIPPSLVVGTQYFYRVSANLTTGCPLNPSTPIAMFGLPTYNDLNCGGGIADGHASLRTCPIFLDGTFNSPNSQNITVYMSTEHNFVAWPQETGVSDYTVQFATAALGPWSDLIVTASLNFAHVPPSLITPTQYFYRVRANLNTGCPLNPSVTFSQFALPAYNDLNALGGLADGDANGRTCPILLNGLPDAAQSPVPTVYPSQDYVFITWPQVAGANTYLLELSTDAGINWASLSNSAILTYQHTVSGGTNYTYRLTAQLSTGCTLLPSGGFTTTPAPSYNFYFGGIADGHASGRSCTFVTLDQSTVNILGATTFCFGGSVNLKASQAVLYTWFKDGVPITPGGVSQEITLYETGIYTVEVFNIFSCSAASLEIEIIAHPLPPNPPQPVLDPAGISCGPVELIALGDPSPNTYYWLGNDPNSTDLSYPGNNPFLASVSGTYYLRSLSTENCWSDGLSQITVFVTPLPSEITPATNISNCAIGSNNAWNYFIAPDGKAIAAIQNDGQALGNCSSTCFVSIAAINRFDGVNEFLPRHYLINTAQSPANPVKVRLYFSSSELNAFVAASQASPSFFDDVNGITDLFVTKYNGPTEDGVFNMLDATDFVSLIPDNVGTDLNGLFVEITVGGFSEFWIHGNNMVPLPVELLSFEAVCNPNNILLKWATASETNNHFFEIEHSTNLQQWNSLAIVEGSGNSNQIIQYQHQWYNPPSVVNYFRLRQQDFNGEESFSGIISSFCEEHKNLYPFEIQFITFGNSDGNLVQFLYPNKSDIKVEVFDEKGRLVFQQQIYTNEGINQLNLSSVNWAKGIYLLRLSGNHGQKSRKLINF